jgi:hypothetical protein
MMPNQLRKGSLRVSYVEEVKIHKAMKILAATKGVTISALTRKATEEFLKKEDPAGILLKSAEKLSKAQADTANKRLQENSDKEIIEISKIS